MIESTYKSPTHQLQRKSIFKLTQNKPDNPKRPGSWLVVLGLTALWDRTRKYINCTMVKFKIYAENKCYYLFSISLRTLSIAFEIITNNKRAMRSRIAPRSKQVKGQTRHLNQLDTLKLSNYERHWLKVKGWSTPLMQKDVLALT